ncbi:gamma-glutamylcyclotransferase family protein [Flavobacterium psychrotolerans]|uniref:Gamma-glutamylcyclotransferase n=1 Tax=Flavobacterium psychrotolerans TaxID=2169410 RepID=A0A2U1JH38_9FLAO|nr:gamma-glutamylcyclotransferase family protein [Flavobacterium psychrotolerans]PWA04335.1 gamma-glutamylcyclotransferase [Flavobacterium psychrotolerans]
MEKLFAYGTLKDKDIQETIFGRILTGIPDKLIGYAIQEIHIEEEFGIAQYPIITATQNPKDSISGILYEISLKELQLADTYEGIHYKRIQVELHSNEIVWVYSAKI